MAIHWNITKSDYAGKSRWKTKYITVECPACGYTRWKPKGDVVRYMKNGNPEYDGRCNTCAKRAQPSYKGGTWLKGDGYTLFRDNHFTAEEMEILRPMWPKSLGYIRGNRAIMALHLGRALCADEIVHHKNGDRSDDRIENLELLKRSTHHNGHGDNYYQKWQEALSEIDKLKKQISKSEPPAHKTVIA